MNNPPLYLSYTGMDSAARCPRYFYFDRVRKIESQKESLGKRFGSAGHVGLHKLYETKDLQSCLNAAELSWQPYEGMDVNKEGKPGVRTWVKLKEILTAYHQQLYVGEDWTDQGGEMDEKLEIPIPSERSLLFTTQGYNPYHIVYRAKIDRKGLSGNVPSIQEWKFLKPIMGSDFVPEPNNQIVGYLKVMKAKKAIVTVAKVQVSSAGGMVKGRLKSDEPHSIFVRDPVFYEDFVYEEFERDVVGWGVSILTWQAANYWPKSAPGACNDYGGCPFKSLCAVPPEQREVLIELSFKKKEPYKPSEKEDVAEEA